MRSSKALEPAQSATFCHRARWRFSPGASPSTSKPTTALPSFDPTNTHSGSARNSSNGPTNPRPSTQS